MDVWRWVLLAVGVMLMLASAYVERHRDRYDREVRTLGAFSFAGGVAAVALATVG